jgi:predicted nucleic acid-binding protein
MITALDTSVLLDVLLDDPKYRPSSLEALRAAHASGTLIVCPVVWAETRGAVKRPEAIAKAFEQVDITFDPFDQAAADLAGDLWRTYRRRGGTRTRLVPDFLVGAHAQLRSGRILSRDRGFLRTYFKDLAVIDPSPRPPELSGP